MNITSLVGNSGGTATLTVTKKGTKIANFSIATVERYKNAEGIQQKHTDWHKVAVFGPLAEVVAKYVGKGTVISVSGALHISAYTDKAGVAQASSTLHANFFEIMSGGLKPGKTDNSANADKKNQSIPAIGDTCPKCNAGKIIEKKFKDDKFLACDNYPECKNTYNIAK